MSLDVELILAALDKHFDAVEARWDRFFAAQDQRWAKQVVPGHIEQPAHIQEERNLEFLDVPACIVPAPTASAAFLPVDAGQELVKYGAVDDKYIPATDASASYDTAAPTPSAISLVDRGNVTGKHHYEASIVADTWGGLFEHPAHVREEHDPDVAACIVPVHACVTPVPESCLTSTNEDDTTSTPPARCSTDCLSHDIVVPKPICVVPTSTLNNSPSRCSMQVHSSETAVMTLPASAYCPLHISKDISEYISTWYISIDSYASLRGIVLLHFATKVHEGSEVLVGMTSQCLLMPWLLSAYVLDIGPWPPPLQNKNILLSDTIQSYLSLGLSFCYGQDVVKQRPPWPPPLPCCQNFSTDTAQPCLRLWQYFICGLGDGQLRQPWPPPIQWFMQDAGNPLRPIPWPSFGYFAGHWAVLWIPCKFPWLLIGSVGGLLHDKGRLSNSRAVPSLVAMQTAMTEVFWLLFTYHHEQVQSCKWNCRWLMASFLKQPYWNVCCGQATVQIPWPPPVQCELQINEAKYRDFVLWIPGKIPWQFLLKYFVVVHRVNILPMEVIVSAIEVQILVFCQLNVLFQAPWPPPDGSQFLGCQCIDWYLIQKKVLELWPIFIGMFQRLPLFICVTSAISLHTSLSLSMSRDRYLMQSLSWEFSSRKWIEFFKNALPMGIAIDTADNLKLDPSKCSILWLPECLDCEAGSVSSHWMILLILREFLQSKYCTVDHHGAVPDAMIPARYCSGCYECLVCFNGKEVLAWHGNIFLVSAACKWDCQWLLADFLQWLFENAPFDRCNYNKDWKYFLCVQWELPWFLCLLVCWVWRAISTIWFADFHFASYASNNLKQAEVIYKQMADPGVLILEFYDLIIEDP